MYVCASATVSTVHEAKQNCLHSRVECRLRDVNVGRVSSLPLNIIA